MAHKVQYIMNACPGDASTAVSPAVLTAGDDCTILPCTLMSQYGHRRILWRSILVVRKENNRMRYFTTQGTDPVNGVSTAELTELPVTAITAFHVNSMNSTKIIRKNVVDEWSAQRPGELFIAE